MTGDAATRSVRARPSNNPFLALGTRRALISIAVALAIWEIGSTSRVWLGHALPILGAVPPPVSVAVAWSQLVRDPGYWQNWYWSFLRVLLGFSAATLVGVPFGLFLAISKTFRGIAFPVFELLRPIPPLAWVPASIIFWPTQELSIDFVIFLGAFYTIVLNVLGGGQVDRSAPDSGRALDGRNALEYFPPNSASRHPAFDLHRYGSGHRNHLGGGRRRRDDFRRRRVFGRRIGLLHLELLYRRLLSRHHRPACSRSASPDICRASRYGLSNIA
ncbi:MAG: hypothetical protein WDN29_04110 [Methylovirgula sp.]